MYGVCVRGTSTFVCGTFVNERYVRVRYVQCTRTVRTIHIQYGVYSANVYGTDLQYVAHAVQSDHLGESYLQGMLRLRRPK